MVRIFLMPQQINCEDFSEDCSCEETIEQRSWIRFHGEVINKREPLDWLIETISKLGLDGEVIDTPYKFSDGSGCDIYSHEVFFPLAQIVSKERFIRKLSGEEGTFFEKNLIHNVLRVLKKMKSGEPISLLPHEDISVTRDYLDRLKRKPIFKPYF